jgi:hypothetical protein
MTHLRSLLGLLIMSTVITSGAEPARPRAAMPVQSLMLFYPAPAVLEDFLRFVREDLPREGVTHLVLQIDYGYQFKSRPEMAGAVTEAEVKRVVAACREAGVELIPLVNCFGHQSWAKTTHRLLTVHPEFDETPGKYPENEGIYCRSYCPNHPDVHAVVFDLLAEIATVFEAKALHTGLDEVFLIAEKDCKRCRGADPAEVFAQEVRTLADFLRGRGVRMWVWGDRFLDGRTTGLGEWEASLNHTHRAIDLVPRDIVICDWHYEAAPPTAAYFAMKGFEVIACSWNKPPVALAQVELIAEQRAANARNKIGPRLLGVMSTCWSPADRFLTGHRAAQKNGGPAPDALFVDNFTAMFARLREMPGAVTAPQP